MFTNTEVTSAMT